MTKSVVAIRTMQLQRRHQRAPRTLLQISQHTVPPHFFSCTMSALLRSLSRRSLSAGHLLKVAHGRCIAASTSLRENVGTDPAATARHPRSTPPPPSGEGKSHFLHQPVYTKEELHDVKFSHVEPSNIGDRTAYYAMKGLRTLFDKVTGYGKNMDEGKYLTRFLFLETVAGVPGMVGGMIRHMSSLRTMERDRGWIHTLLEEAENERMHLMTFLAVRQPGSLFRFCVLLGQGVFFNLYFFSYLVAPRVCHRFVGYLEEEAVKTYTTALKDLDAGNLPTWSDSPAPSVARKYWQLPKEATMKDVLLAVRADEANHRDVNHKFSEIRWRDPNPFD